MIKSFLFKFGLPVLLLLYWPKKTVKTPEIHWKIFMFRLVDRPYTFYKNFSYSLFSAVLCAVLWDYSNEIQVSWMLKLFESALCCGDNYPEVSKIDRFFFLLQIFYFKIVHLLIVIRPWPSTYPFSLLLLKFRNYCKKLHPFIILII